jgi:hypothetical protein
MMNGGEMHDMVEERTWNSKNAIDKSKNKF